MNEGQFAEDVDYLARVGDDQIFIIDDGGVVIDRPRGRSGHAVAIDWVGAGQGLTPDQTGPTGATSSYFLGDDPDEWITDVPAYRTVTYADIYPGIDVEYLSSDDQFRYDLIVGPGADPGTIALAIDGTNRVQITPGGSLRIVAGDGAPLEFSPPVSYQDTDDGRIEIDSAYEQRPDGSIGFAIGDYDADLPLVIDPTLEYASYLGGTGTDTATAVEVDGSGNVVIAGSSASTDFPVSVGAYDVTANSGNDVVVAKFSPDGTTRLWATYVGGSLGDSAYDLALDASGNAYVSVFTVSTNFPTSAGAYDTSLSGSNEGAVFKLSANGSSLAYSTYLGASNTNDYLYAIAVDGSGQAVVAGATDGNNWPTTAGAYDTSFGGTFDAVVTKLNATGTGLVWSTYLGGTGSDTATAVAIGPTGNVFVTGQAASGFPTTAGAYDTTHNGSFDVWAGVLSATGNALNYATFLGTTGTETGEAIAVTDTNIFHVVGKASASGFPTTAGAYDTTYGGSDDTFVAKLDRSQTTTAQLVYSTYLGGAGLDRGQAVTVDSSGRAHVAIYTQSNGLATPGAHDTTVNAGDGLYGVLSSSGATMEYASYIGGSANDTFDDIALTPTQSAWLVGGTSSNDLPATANAYDPTLSGTSDGLLVRFDAEPLDPVVLDDIQKGTATLTPGSSTVTATIAAVDPTRAFLTYTIRGSDNSPDDITVTGELTNATTVTFAREGISGTVNIEWSVVEFVSGVTVQRGSTTLSASTTDIPIATVDLSRSFTLVNSRSGGGTFGASDFVRALLTSPTSLRVEVTSSASNAVQWQVITYNDAVVQRGTTVFAAGDATRTATTAAVDAAKSWLVYSTTTAAGTANDIGQKLIRGQITNGTTITFDRSSTGQTLDVAWELVEFTDATSVQHASAAFAGGQTLRDVTISTVDATRSIAVGGTTLIGGRSAYTADDNPGEGWFTTRLSSSTNLRIERDRASAAADLGWFVISWPDPLVVNSTGNSSDTNAGDGVCSTGGTVGSDPECTLRAAIQEANAQSGPDTIHFDIPVSDANYQASPVRFRIPVSTFLTPITDPVVIDGTTQDEFTVAGRPVVVLDGAGMSAPEPNGITLQAGSSTIRGLVVQNFGDDGIEIEIAGGNTIVGNYIGTDVTGTLDRGNGWGVAVKTSDNVIGGTGTADRNIIAGNTNYGLSSYNGATGNVILGNHIGVDVDGDPLGNGSHGIELAGATAGNIVGGTEPAAGNVIAHNGGDGVSLLATAGADNTIVGNTLADNANVAIDLDDDGATANDGGDGDTGPNDLLNKPVIRSATESGGTVSVTFDLDVPANADGYRVEFFTNPGGTNPAGNYEAEQFATAVTVAPGTGRTASFAGTVGDVVTATATRIDPGTATGYSSTSEVSAQRIVSNSGAWAVWRRSGQSTPFASRYQGGTFGSTVATASVGEFRVMQAAEAPQRDETIVVGVASSGTIAGEMWNGSSWSALPPLGSTNETFWWSAEVAYEGLSSDAVVVYTDGADLNYRVWDGTNWSPEAAIAEPTAGTPRQLRLAGDRESDELVLIVSDDASRDYAIVWNGSAWGNAVLLDGAGTGNDRTDISVAYEHQSGDALVVFGKGTNNVSYRTWNGTVWSSEAVLTGIAGGYARWTTLGADPGSDRIALGVVTNDSDVWLAVWNGSTWIDQTTATLTTTGTNHPAVAVGFESVSGQAIATYGEAVVTPRYRTWASGSGWSAQLSAPSIGAVPNSQTLSPDPRSDAVMLAVQDADSDLHYLRWTGSAWGADTEVETATAENKNQPFVFVWDAAPPTTPFPPSPATTAPGRSSTRPWTSTC